MDILGKESKKTELLSPPTIYWLIKSPLHFISNASYVFFLKNLAFNFPALLQMLSKWITIP